MEQKFELVDIKSQEFKDCVKQIIKDSCDIIAAYGIKDDRYILLKDGWILDVKTGKQYGPSSDVRLSKADAIIFCKERGGVLPERDDLISIQDLSRHSPCSNPIFKDMKSDYYWSNTKCAWDAGASWVVSFNDGFVDYFLEYFKFYVRPVRASQ